MRRVVVWIQSMTYWVLRISAFVSWMCLPLHLKEHRFHLIPQPTEHPSALAVFV